MQRLTLRPEARGALRRLYGIFSNFPQHPRRAAANHVGVDVVLRGAPVPDSCRAPDRRPSLGPPGGHKARHYTGSGMLTPQTDCPLLASKEGKARLSRIRGEAPGEQPPPGGKEPGFLHDHKEKACHDFYNFVAFTHRFRPGMPCFGGPASSGVRGAGFFFRVGTGKQHPQQATANTSGWMSPCATCLSCHHGRAP